MIETRQGDILKASAEALVNTVNTVGVMGKGVALQFRLAYPENYKAYARACKQDDIQVGRVFVYHRSLLEEPKYIINFPTKRHWRERSRLKYIRDGLDDLVRQVRQLGIRSIALPPLGCGNGGLSWREVRSMIEAASYELPEVKVIVYEPHVTDEPKPLVAHGARPALTPVRAALLKLFETYDALGETLSKTEAQKIIYFLQQSAGIEKLQLDYTKGEYGPYAQGLTHVLKALEGHYIEGYGDGTTRARIQLKPGTSELVESFLKDHPELQEPLEKTKNLINGFETSYGMELLATVHWAARNEQAEDLASVIKAVHRWSERKKNIFTRDQIRVAWKHLLDEEWVSAATSPVVDHRSDDALRIN